MPVEHAYELAAAFRDARVVLLDDCRTLIPIDRPAALAQSIDAFLAGEPVGSTAEPHRKPNRRRRRWYASTGWWCSAVALGHLAATALFYGESLRELTSGPLFGALDANPHDPAARGAAFWYVTSGIALLGLGWGARTAEAAGRPPSREFATCLTVLGVMGVIASPLSPFWIVLAIGVTAAARRRSAIAERRFLR